MIYNFNNRRRAVIAGGVALAFVCLGATHSVRAQDMAPLNLKLPAPAFIGTPSDKEPPPNVEPLSKTPRPPFMAPVGTVNLALGKKVTSSATNALPEDLAKITDGEKEANDANIVLLARKSQWVQIDLGAQDNIYAVVLWHAHDKLKVYHGVVVQLADGPGFGPADNVRTIFNNDSANTAEQGVGTNLEYFETNEGKLIDAKGVPARYVRLYSNGSTAAKYNEYLEVEVYGKPAK